MNWNQVFWLAVVLVGIVALACIALIVLRRQVTRSTQAVRMTWLIAAIMSGTTLIFIAAKVVELIPDATVVDVGALAVTGVLTGFLLALGLRRGPTSGES